MIKIDAINPVAPTGAARFASVLLLAEGIMDAAATKPSPHPTDQRVVDILDLISSRYAELLTLRLMTERVNVSRSRLNSIFRAAIGMTPLVALKSRRMAIAADLLRATRLSVKEIAGKVGIVDQSHFVRDFERRYGLSPKAFRKAYLLSLLERRTAR